MQIRNSCSKMNKYINALILSILMILSLFSRILYLDSDLPYKILHSYAVFDEFYYTIPGFNLFHYGEVNPSIVTNVLEEKIPPNNISQNLTTYLTLKVFGNNFYGLRMGSVCCAFFIFVIFYLLLRRILVLNHLCVKSQFKARLMLFIPLLYLLFDFSFLAAGRVAEPTIYRMLALVIMLYVGSLIDLNHIKPWHSILLGFLAFANISFVYIYNAFVYAAFGTAIFTGIFKKGTKKVLQHMALFGLGTIICLLLYSTFINICYHSSLLEVYKSLLPFQSRIGGSATPGFDSYIINTSLMLMTNIFRFNFILLFMFLVSMPVFIDRIKRKLGSLDLYILALIGFLILQSVIINDYALRKLLVMLPLVLIILVESFIHAENYFNALKPEQLRIIKIYWALVWIIGALVFYYYAVSDLKDESLLMTNHFTVLNFVIFLFGTIILSFNYLYFRRIPKAFIIVLLAAILLPNILLDFRYIFFNRTTEYRDTMIAMSEKIDDKIIVGGLSYAFRLYNTSIPMLDFYTTEYSANIDSAARYDKYFDQLFADGAGSYSIGVMTAKHDEDIINVSYMTKHNLQLQQEYNLENIIDVNVGLFIPIIINH